VLCDEISPQHYSVFGINNLIKCSSYLKLDSAKTHSNQQMLFKTQ